MSDDNPTSGGKEDTRLSSPFSTGGGGTRFEFQVQAAFATLMLAGGFAPCLPCLPIKSIKQQARHAGYRTDDLVVSISNPSGSETRRLLVQVKHGISFTKSDEQFSKTIADAWRDFNDAAIFTRGMDAIAIISGPLSATDVEDTRRILEWARDQGPPAEFFQNIGKTNFSSETKREKLAAFRAHIDAAAGKRVSDDDVFEFLRHLHVLSYDLDVRAGMMHALLHSIVGRHSPENPASLFSRVFEHVSSSNQNAGTLTVESFPDDIREGFRPRVVEVMPASLTSTIPPPTEVNWNASEFAEALAIANLLGGWNEHLPTDMAIIAALTPDQPSEWLRKMREVVQRPESPLVHVNGVWTVKNRVAMWTSLAPRLFNKTLAKFRECAVKVFSERNPAFDLDSDKRFAAQIYGKVLSHSVALRSGMADTLALLGTSTVRLPNCAMKAGEDAATMVMRDLFADADWQLWGSLDLLLPTLGEAAPRAFLDAVEAALQKHPCPFDSLFAQEGDAMTGGNYITGLLWALETLAWDETYLVRVAVILAMLAARDPGGNWGNRPANSLTTIFLPWFPQTRASIGKREVAVKAVVRERREVGWRLLLRLLPSHHGMSTGSHKPKWRNKVDSDEVPRPTVQDYWAQVAAYAQMAIDVVRLDSDNLEELIDSLDKLPEPALNQVLEFAKTDAVTGLPDERRLPIWSKLSAFVRRHRQYAEAEWALPAEAVDKIDQVASLLAPEDPSVAHRILFSGNTWDLHDDQEDWQKSEERLAQRQRDAVEKIYDRGGLAAVMSFAEKVENPSQVGFALGKLGSIHVDADLLPSVILSPESKRRELVRGYVWAMFQRLQWSWFDARDTAAWSSEEIAQVLTYLPFDAEAWKRANERLPDDGKEYWTRVPVHGFMRADSDYVAVDALMRHGRPRAAVLCLAARVHDKQAIDPMRAIEALLKAIQSCEPRASVDQHGAAMVIKAVQDEGHADKKELIAVEWAYLQVLEHSHITRATTLGGALASEPDLFCEVIRTIFRSDKEAENQQRPEPTEERRAIAQNAYHLLETWATVPGTDASGDVSGEQLRSWIDAVKASLEQSGHLVVGLHKAGEVFIRAPVDPSGLFMHRAVADVLNRQDMDELRRGYELAVHNSRGAHFVDPTGAPEKELARVYNEKADAVENAGYHRLAVTLRSISESYEREAERNIARYGGEKRTQDPE
jgi:hypothetical protein